MSDAKAKHRPERGHRHRLVRARTVSVQRMTKWELEKGRLLYPEPVVGRPKTRGECMGIGRPCLYVGCKYNLYLDVNPLNGAIKLNFPDLEPEQMGECCALDIAARGGHPLEVVAEYANLTRERVRQIELLAFRRLETNAVVLREFADEPGRTAVRSRDGSWGDDG